MQTIVVNNSKVAKRVALKKIIGLSYNSALWRYQNGYISEKIWITYVRLWNWGGHRSCRQQDRHWDRCGAVSYYARVGCTLRAIKLIQSY